MDDFENVQQEEVDLTNYYVDILKDDLCDRDVDGWFTVKEVEAALDSQAGFMEIPEEIERPDTNAED